MLWIIAAVATFLVVALFACLKSGSDYDDMVLGDAQYIENPSASQLAMALREDFRREQGGRSVGGSPIHTRSVIG